MSKILPYPWQHSAYDEFDKVSDRIVFCLEREKEAKQCGLYQVAKAWETEAAKYIPALLDHFKELEAALERIRDGSSTAWHIARQALGGDI